MQHLGGRPDSSEHAYDLAVDTQGNTLLLAGYSGTATLGTHPLANEGSCSPGHPGYEDADESDDTDMVLAKLSAGGEVLWAVTAGGPGSCFVSGSVVTDATNHVYLSARFLGTPVTLAGERLEAGPVLAKFSPEGRLLWWRPHSARGLVLAAETGKLWALGFQQREGRWTSTLLRLSTEGDVEAEYEAGMDEAHTLHADATGHLWVLGRQGSSDRGGVMRRFTPDGQLTAELRIEAPLPLRAWTSPHVSLSASTVTPDGVLIVGLEWSGLLTVDGTTYSEGERGTDPQLLVALSPQGTVRWVRHTTQGHRGLALDASSGEVVAVGRRFDAQPSQALHLTSFEAATGQVRTVQPLPGHIFWLNQLVLRGDTEVYVAGKFAGVLASETGEVVSENSDSDLFVSRLKR